MLMVVGTAVILFPYFQGQYYASNEQSLINEFRELDTIFEDQEVDTEERSLVLESAMGGVIGTADSPTKIENVVGLLHIEKIELTLPLLEGASETNLKVGAGVLTSTSPFGEEGGNTGIAAHRSHTYGRQFNRLDEIEEGDLVVVETRTGEYQFEVFQTSVVAPEDVSVLQPIDHYSVVTLITCTPVIDPTHRLIVHAKKG